MSFKLPESTRTLLPAGLAALCFFSALFFYSNAATLLKENAALVERSNELEQKLAAAQKEVISGAEFKKSIEALSKENAALKADIEKTQKEIEEKIYLEDMLIHKSREIEALKTGIPSQPAEYFGPPSELTEKLKLKDADLKKLAEKNQILTKKIEILYKITNDKMSEIDVARASLEDTIQNARRMMDEEMNAVDLGSINVETAAAVPAAPPAAATAAPAPAAPPAKTNSHRAKDAGRVLAVNEDHGFVVVDLGKADGIGPSTSFAVKKNGVIVGTLKALEIRDVMTACDVKDLTTGVKIEVNDLVSIRK